jgi:hypothetical protein
MSGRSLANGVFLILPVKNTPSEENQDWLLFLFGKVKNNNSGWINEADFQWGEEPVLIEKVPFILKIKDPRPCQIFGLDAKGLPFAKPLEMMSGEKDTYFLYSNTPIYWIHYQKKT